GLLDTDDMLVKHCGRRCKDDYFVNASSERLKRHRPSIHVDSYRVPFVGHFKSSVGMVSHVLQESLDSPKILLHGLLVVIGILKSCDAMDYVGAAEIIGFKFGGSWASQRGNLYAFHRHSYLSNQPRESVPNVFECVI